MKDRELFLQTLGQAIEMMQQVDIIANRDSAWPERITPADQLQYAKELRIILAYLRAVRDLIETYSMLAGAPDDIAEPSRPKGRGFVQ